MLVLAAAGVLGIGDDERPLSPAAACALLPAPRLPRGPRPGHAPRARCLPPRRPARRQETGPRLSLRSGCRD